MAGSVEHKKILLVLTNMSTLGESSHITGAHLTEITTSYDAFMAAGYEVDMVSPRGGKIPLNGVRTFDVFNAKWLKDPSFHQKIEQSMRPWEVNADHYVAIYFIGGHGAVYDLPENKNLQKITTEIFENEGLVAGICHGVSGIMNVKLSDGQYLVKDHEVTCCTNEEEKSMGLDREVPFLLQTKLQERGALVKAGAAFKENIVISGRLLTGQNPDSSRALAHAIIEVLHQIQQGHFLPEKPWCDVNLSGPN